MGHRRVRVLDVAIDPIRPADLMSWFERFVRARLPHQVVTVNPEFLIEARSNRDFRAALKDAELALADGHGIQLAATIRTFPRPSWFPLGLAVTFLQWAYASLLLLVRSPRLATPIPATIPGADLVSILSKRAEDRGWRIYILAGPDPLATDARALLVAHYPKLTIVGAETGVTPSDALDSPAAEALVERIRRARPDILFVGFGAPRQDLFISKYKAALGVPIMIGVGGAFDFLAGRVRRAPHALRMIGFEWLWRLFVQPWRWRRILRAVVAFPLAVSLEFAKRSS